MKYAGNRIFHNSRKDVKKFASALRRSDSSAYFFNLLPGIVKRFSSRKQIKLVNFFFAVITVSAVKYVLIDYAKRFI